MNATTTRTGFMTAIKTGLTAPDTVVADGKVHRFKVKWDQRIRTVGTFFI